MNAILLGGASLAALLTFLTAEAPETASIAPGTGSMSRVVESNATTGETSETRIIAFLD
ncbi:MAG: hypothetical protein SGJ21_07600 [Alphaproteobacteria bacterium]|nr:hypothetical protein [Alphaproteobacteria bacterium]